MNREALLNAWLAEEACAQIHGWDFSHIDGRYESENDLPWNYREVIRRLVKPEHHLLDIDTGGGEFLLSLRHPYARTSATEAYDPNIKLCQEILFPLGIHFQAANGTGPLPFANDQFDRVINRHGSYHPGEIHRVLKPGGIFITEQVGVENDRELIALLLGNVPAPRFPEQYLDCARARFEQCGFSIVEAQEAFRPIRFWDVGALVWFARIISWEFPGFSVNSHLERLYSAQEKLEKEGVLEGRIHRFLLVAQKANIH